MALRKVLPEPPDLILSGVNRGANLGDDVTYSGTVSAAMEGALAGIRSIALSQVYDKEGMGDAVPFDAAHGVTRFYEPGGCTDCAAHAHQCKFPAGDERSGRGIRVVRQGFHDYARGSVVESTDPRGYRYFWFGLHGIEHTHGHNTDLEAIAENYISVTPLQLDLTHDASLAALAERFTA
jgi:5'-nucleotidase